MRKTFKASKMAPIGDNLPFCLTSARSADCSTFAEVVATVRAVSAEVQDSVTAARAWRWRIMVTVLIPEDGCILELSQDMGMFAGCVRYMETVSLSVNCKFLKACVAACRKAVAASSLFTIVSRLE